MQKLITQPPNTFTVICRWYPPNADHKPCHHIAVVIANCDNARDAANNACLYLIWDRQGMAEPWLVLEGKPSLISPVNGIFDANEYEETITFAGQIISQQKLDN